MTQLQPNSQESRSAKNNLVFQNLCVRPKIRCFIEYFQIYFENINAIIQNVKKACWALGNCYLIMSFTKIYTFD